MNIQEIVDNWSSAKTAIVSIVLDPVFMSESLNHSLNKSFKNTDSFNNETPLCKYFVGEAKLDEVFCLKCKLLNIKLFFVELHKTKITLATHAKAARAVIKFRKNIS